MLTINKKESESGINIIININDKNKKCENVFQCMLSKNDLITNFKST